MKYKLIYNTENHHKIISSVVGIGIDSPKAPLATDEPEFIFSGWLIGKDRNIKLLLNYVHCHKVLALKVDRPDVVKHFEDINIIAELRCGFHERVSFEGLKSISISIDGIEYDVFSVLSLGFDIDNLNNASSLWLCMHEKRNVEKNQLVVSNVDIICDFKTLSKNEFLSVFGHDICDFEVVKNFFSNLSDPYWSLKISDVLIKEKTLTLHSFFSSESVVARFSINIVDFNFIYFSNSNESFYLVQHCANISIVFPTLFVVVSLSEVGPLVKDSLNKLPSLFKYLQDNYRYYSGLMFENNNGVFLGFNVTQSRPYHYFYDYVYGLMCLVCETNVKSEKIKVFSVKGFDFYNLSSIHENIDYEGSDESSLNAYVIKQSGFLIMPCIQYCRSELDRDLTRLSYNLIASANRKHEGILSLVASAEYLKIWIGVSNEKRSWIEQIDGFSNIINELSLNFKNIQVLVDGRTFPLNPRSADIANKHREDLLFDVLCEKNPSVEFINMIGMQAIEKIYLAQQIDFFISSYATDSIYPSAICQKPGVVYVAPTIGDQKHLHIHHNIIEVPSHKVKEVMPSDGVKKSWHETSISMDWRDVYECVLQLIDKFEIRK